ncbi:MAG: hypothetical protein HOH50_10700, partial [Planctomycetaceae bacterium]|nr:hypothetical protein [Planctomycetaceae bacterium]
PTGIETVNNRDDSYVFIRASGQPDMASMGLAPTRRQADQRLRGVIEEAVGFRATTVKSQTRVAAHR